MACGVECSYYVYTAVEGPAGPHMMRIHWILCMHDTAMSVAGQARPKQ